MEHVRKTFSEVMICKIVYFLHFVLFEKTKQKALYFWTRPSYPNVIEEIFA